MNFFLLPLSHSNLDAETDSVAHHNLGKHHGKTIEEIAPEVGTWASVGSATTCIKCVLIADVKHTEEDSGNQRNHYKEDRALGVDGVVNLCATHLSCLIGHKEECLRCIKERAESAELTSF